MGDSREMQYELVEGGFIRVFGSEVIFVNPETNESETIHAGAAKIVKRLLDNPNETVTYEQLYCAYQGHSTPSSNVQRDVQNMRNKIPAKLRDSMYNHTNQGYSLAVKERIVLPKSTTLGNLEGANSNELLHLSGEYYAFYPGKGEGQTLGAYIYVQNAGDHMDAYAVLDVQHREDLLQVPNLFTKGCDCFFESDFDGYIRIDRRNLFEGKLEKCSEYVAVIMLGSIIDRDQWQIVLNLKDFMTSPRDYTKDENLYRGGLGIKLGGRTNDISASRVVLIRKSLFIDKYMGLDSRDIREYLLSSNCVSITEQSDHDFYQWLVGKHSAIDK